MLLASDIVEHARSYLEVPWRHRGRSREGIDCIGLILAAYGAAGWKPRHSQSVERLDYHRLSTRDELVDVLRHEGEEISIDELKAGDVVVFRFPGHAWTQHVGLVTGYIDARPYFIHSRAEAHRRDSKVVEHALADGWLLSLDCAFRFPQVNQ